MGQTTHSPHYVYDLTNREHVIWHISFPTATWVALLILGLVIHGRWGLWLLVPAPFALYWPYQFAKLYIECWLGTKFICPG
jgi:hypothetical protein